MALPLSNSTVDLDAGSGAAVVAVHGEVDASNAPDLALRIGNASRDTRGPVIVDLRDASFVAASGMRVLVDAHTRLRRQERRLALVCPPSPTLQLFSLTRLLEADELGVFGTRRAAIDDEQQEPLTGW